MLSLFYNSTEALHEASGNQTDILESLKQQSEILKVLVIGYQEFQEGKRAEPAYSQVARTIGQGQQEEQKQQTNEAAVKELRAEGIENSIILKHQHLIKEWLETVILASTEDPNDDDATSVVGPSTAVDDDAGLLTLHGLSMDESMLSSYLIIHSAKNLNKIQFNHMCLEMNLPWSPVRTALAHIEASQVDGIPQKQMRSGTMRL